MSEAVPETPTKAARVLILGFALACTFRAVEHYEWPWTADSAASLGLAVVLTIADWKLPWVLRQAGPRATQTLNNVATDARWWIAIGFGIFLLMSVSEGFTFLRNTVNHPSGLVWGNPPTESDFDGRPLGLHWAANFLGAVGGGPGQEVSYFIVYGRNFGSEEVKINDAYIISGIDSSKLQFKINSIPDGFIDIEKASSVPVGADITLQVIFGNGFMPETDFRKKWDEFYVVVETDNQKIRHLVDRSFVHRFLDANHPELSPHVTKK